MNNANRAIESNSLYGNKHRFIAVVSQRWLYGRTKNFATTASLFGTWTSGDRFAYVYGGDLNNDGTTTNDLIYVPTDAEIDLMNFAPLTDVNGIVQNGAAQRVAFKQYLQKDSYLSGLRGKYTEKYGGQNPWYSQVDFRVLQDFMFKTRKSTQTIQFSIDIINLGNLISSDWGVRKTATNSGYFQPLSVSLAGSTPTYQFDPSIKETFTASPDLISRWQMQFGLRYLF